MRGGWTRARGTAIVRERSGGSCEICRTNPGQEFSHRIAASRCGTWAPSNGVRACHGCHSWLEHHPLWATGGWWHIRRDPRSPLELPVFLKVALLPRGGWFLLDDAGGMELVDPDDHDLPGAPLHLPYVVPGGRPLATVPWVAPR